MMCVYIYIYIYKGDRSRFEQQSIKKQHEVKQANKQYYNDNEVTTTILYYTNKTYYTILYVYIYIYIYIYIYT